MHTESWFYHCIDYDRSACANCIYKKVKLYPTIKWGITYNYSSHPHPLTLVQATKKSPSCDVCHCSCFDIAKTFKYLAFGNRYLAFECSKCNIMLHPDCAYQVLDSLNNARQVDFIVENDKGPEEEIADK